MSNNHHAFDPNNAKKSYSRSTKGRPRQPRNSVDEKEAREVDENTEVETINVPHDMVGCIIGKGGQFINQIRKVSGAKLHIANQVDNSPERVIKITGTKEANQSAISLVRDQLDVETQRRLSKENAIDTDLTTR